MQVHLLYSEEIALSINIQSYFVKENQKNTLFCVRN